MVFDPAMREFLERFEGTPHVQRRREAGRGVDCIQLVIGALEAGGAFPPVTLPSYLQTNGFSRGRNHIADHFIACVHAESIPIGNWEPREGDVGIFKSGRHSNHVGIVAAGRFWHATKTAGAHHTAIAAVERHLQEIIRIHQPGLKENPANRTLR